MKDGSLRRPLVNAMTVDVEDYFQVSAFESCVPFAAWDHFESRVCRNTERLLMLFGETGVAATFFVLGWVAERYPGLVRKIVSGGHEVASHGYAHRLVYAMNRTEFRDDLRRSRAALEQAAGKAVIGYRAPSYSITARSLWAFDVLAEEGYVYDASVFPIRHDRYGMPNAPRHPYRVTAAGGSLWELPVGTIRFAGQNLPIGGGGYLRLLPYWWTSRGIRHVNTREGRPVMFYVHPWEIDPGQPRVKAGPLSRVRHYSNLDKTEGRVRKLLAEFRFGTAMDMLASASHAAEVMPAAALAEV